MKSSIHYLFILYIYLFFKNTINEVSKDYKDDETVHPVLLWDVLKMQDRARSIKYAKEYNAKQRHSETTLETDISLLEQKLEENNRSDAEKGLSSEVKHVGIMETKRTPNISSDNRKGTSTASR